jgi:hypothetical protein
MTHFAKALRPGPAILLTLAVVLFIYGLSYLTVTTESADDLFECKAIVKEVEAKHEIPASLSAPGQPGIFCDKGVRLPFLTSYDTLFIYGVADKSVQDSIITNLENQRHKSHTGKILVRFFDKENWKTRSDPATGLKGGYRGSETPVREVWVTAYRQ